MSYLFNNNNLNEYLGQTKNNFSDCTTDVKPPEYEQHTLPCFNVQTKEWDKIISDYRNMVAYQKTNSRIKQVIVFVGQIDTNFTVVVPPDQQNWYQFKDNEWKLKVQKIQKTDLSNWLYEQKCQIAYTGIDIIQNGITYKFETSLDSITMCNSTAISLANKEDTYKLYWKVWENQKTKFLQLTKAQFTQIFSFGMTMINQAFSIESELNDIVDNMTDEQLADKEYINKLKNQAITKFNQINKEITI